MSVTIELTSQEIAQLMQITRASGDIEAVSHAVREFLRLSGLRELKTVSGKIEFEDRSTELETLELSEAPFPA
jgi:Arc/MetJ family transcription regulator